MVQTRNASAVRLGGNRSMRLVIVTAKNGDEIVEEGPNIQSIGGLAEW